MAELLIVADDLTGAADTGVHFATRGLVVRVILDRGQELAAEAASAAVLVMDTESRHLDPAEAARRVVEVVRKGRAAGIGRFFKKTDSTLRGNVGSELEALRSASGAAHLAFVPALPGMGRITRGGVQHVHGRPLHESEFAADPLDPVRESSVPALIRRQVDIPVVPLGADELCGEMAVVLPDRGILVLDAETDAELAAIAGWLDRRDLLRAVAGTSGLARVMAERLAGARPVDRAPPRPPVARGPMLAVGGSLHPTSRAQMEHAERSGFEIVAPSPGALLGGAGDGVPEIEGAIAAAVDHLSGGRDVLLRGAAGRADVEAWVALGAELGLPARELHLRVAEGIATIVRRVLAQERVGVLTVLGGDTLAAVIRALGHPALVPRLEIVPGVPLSEITGTGMLLVSKAGGFGDEAVLTRIGDAMRRTGSI